MNIGIIGYGGVGKALVRLLNMQKEMLDAEDLSVTVSYIVDYYGGIYAAKGIDLAALEVFTEREKEEIHELYLFIRFGYSSTNQIGGITGIPGEAFSDETFARLMGEATKYIGRPYVWGGSSPATSFDCSGFVCWSYTKSGVYNLPRTTAQGIYNQCVPVAKEDLKPGDLVFFTGTYNSGSPVSHIGIYVGDNQMLHAGDPIGYANLGNSYWIRHWYGGGRLL